MPGQSDNLGVPDRSPMVPRRDTSGTDTKHPGTSESADARPKPRGNDGNGRVEDRSNGHLAWPAPRRCANLELPTQPPAVWLRRWESSPFMAGRMSIAPLDFEVEHVDGDVDVVAGRESPLESVGQSRSGGVGWDPDGDGDVLRALEEDVP